MNIEPLCVELIAKLEIAVAHRNRERAVAVVDGYFAKMKVTEGSSTRTTSRELADILNVRQSNALSKHGIVVTDDVSKFSEIELLALKGVGNDLIQTLKRNQVRLKEA